MINRYFLIVTLLIGSNIYLAQSGSLNINFSNSSGIYTKNFLLELSTAKNAQIYYTTDGTVPTKEAIKYNTKIKIDTTQVIRAIAIFGANKSPIKTNTYLIEKRKFTLPIIAITVDKEQMFNPSYGLYSKGPFADSVPPYRGANFNSDKELKINIEYFNTANKLGFNQPAGLKIFGGYSRALPQKSFAIISRDDYGDKDFNYPLFINLPYKKYKSFILRNSGSESNKSQFRDVLMTSLVKDLSFDIQEYTTCIVYINGQYWGIYNIREKFNEHFLKKHYKIDKDNVVVMKHRDDLKIGKRLNYSQIVNYITNTNFKDTANIDSLNKLIDINNFLDYNISQTYFANTDAGGNIRYWRSYNDTSRWKWLMFDTDFGFGMDGKTAFEKNTIHDFTTKSNEIWPIPAWSTLFIRKLLENDSIREVYIRKFTTYLSSILEPQVVLNRVDELVNNINHEIDFHHKRWGSNRKNWQDEIKKIKDFGINRPYYIRRYLKEKFNLTDTFLITIKPTTNGKIIFNNYEINKDFKGIYFTDIKNNIKAITTDFYELEKWIGLPGNNPDTSFYLTNNLTIEASFTKKKKSNLYGKLKFTEISFKGDDWIELYNSTDSIINISHWIFLRDNDKRYVIDSNTYIKPKQYLVFSREENDTDKKYKIKSIKGLLAVRDTSLIELYNNTGNLVDSIQLDSLKGNLIQLIDLNSKSSDINNWEKSKKPTPTKINDKEELKKQFHLVLIYGIYPLLGLIMVFLIIFFLKNKNRPHGATE